MIIFADYINKKEMKKITIVILTATLSLQLSAQQFLSLDDCRKMAIECNRTLEQAALKVDMAHYDRAIARANYFPKISASGTYMYNTMDINLVNQEMSNLLQNAGTTLQSALTEKFASLPEAIKQDVNMLKEYMNSPLWQTFLNTLSQTDISQAVNALGKSVDDLLHPDLHNLAVVSVSLQQPVFVGGKIIASNRVAALAEELARSQYDTQYQQTIVDIDQVYWQIVSIAAKKKLAESYSDLLETMARNVQISVDEGVSTMSDALSIKVKANEAAMMLSKATNGLVLAKMLMCKQIGLPLDTEILLADEGIEAVPVPEERVYKSFEEIKTSRPELRSLEYATKIYDGKVKIARADMMPTIAIMASYLPHYPNVQNGFQKKIGNNFSAGVMMSIPIFHGFEALKKTQKAKVEAALYRSKYEDTANMIRLEVSQLHQHRQEAAEKLAMAKSNLDNAEENLRTAMIGFEEGVVASNVTLAAQTAWLQAHSELIDAGVELQMTESNINRAEGNYYRK